MSKKKFTKEFDEQFEAFLKDSLSSEDSVNSAQINKYISASLKGKKKESKHWWDNGEDETDEKLGTGKSFLKKKRDTEPSTNKVSPKPAARREVKGRGRLEVSLSKDSLDNISEKSDEEHGDAYRPRVHLPQESMDSIDTEDLLQPHGSPGNVGMDTLDELADKEQFYQDLERQANGTIDYGRLNQEMSATAYTLSPEAYAKTAGTLAALQDIQDEAEEESLAPRPSTRGEIGHSERDHSEQKPSMLSKVSLMDSLESTMNTTTSPQIGRGTMREAQSMLEEEEEEQDMEGSNDRPGHSMPETYKTGFIGTNTSQEIEALHKALERVGLSATIGNDSQLELSSQGDKDTDELVKKLLNSGTNNPGQQRDVGQILQELEKLQHKVATDDSRQNTRERSPGSLERQPPVDLDFGELRGFALSPAVGAPEVSHRDPASQRGDHSNRDGSHRGDYSQRGDSSNRGGFDTSHTEDTEMYQPVTQVSIQERGRSKKKDQKKSAGKKKTVQESQQKPRQQKTDRGSTLDRSRSNSPLKIDFSESIKAKYNKVKSSGYGHISPSKPPHSKHKERDILGYTRTKGMREPSVSPVRSPSKPSNTTQPISPVKKDSKLYKTDKSWSPAEVSKRKVKGNQSMKQARLGTVETTQLQASVESFAQYIKDHFSARTAGLPEVKYSQDEPSMSGSFKEKQDDTGQTEDKDEIIAKLRGELEAMERSYERQLETQKLQYEEHLAHLKQENFVLSAKVSGEAETDLKKKLLAGEKVDGVAGDQLVKLQKELKEQETLISGYQQENKRLYDEMRNYQKQTKQVEERMFTENQKLLAEATNLRSQLERKEDQLKNRGVITGLAAQQQIAAGNNAGVINNLETELDNTKRTVDAVNRQMMVLQQTKGDLEKHVERLIIEREELKKRLDESKHMKSEEAQALESQYKEEVDKLTKKLKWYAENQVLLDKSSKQLKGKDDQIHKLKMRIEDLQTESGKRVEDSKVRARERAADTKKIQDLQRQVKEMEQILKRRNPNSLPTLMMAAAAAPNAETANNRTAFTEVLEGRVKKLEKELDEKDGETEKLMRSVEQKYHSVKLQFEERIKELELQLSIYQGQADHVHPHTHAIALERELESVRERYKVQIKDLQAEVDRLTGELNKTKKNSEASAKSELQTTKEVEADLRSQVKALQLEVDNKTHDMQVMQKSLERLRKEKQLAFNSDAGKKQKSKGKKGKSDDGDAEFQSLPAQPVATEKEYEPKMFEEAHISDIIKENEDLKMKIDRIQLKADQQRVDLRKYLAENEAILRQTREDYEDKLEKQRQSQQHEVKRVLADQALQHSTSRLAELQSKCDTQEVMVKHLREQQARLEVEAEAASVLRIKQTRLEETIKSLQRDVREAKKSHTPEMRHFEALQDKISQIETKHAQREQELQDIIRHSKQAASAEVEKEVEKWRRLVETKNNEIQKFRIELDSILEVLRVLQKQGVIIPVSSTAVS